MAPTSGASARVPTASPVLIVANHQSLLDILQIPLLSQPRVPAFVTRARYRRFVPLVSASVRLLGSPIVDPRRDPRGAIEAVREGARTLPHGLIIYPEGHRSTDGEIRPFRTSGLEAILQERRLPVYLVVSDGMWRVRRFTDLLFRVHLVDATSRVLGPIEPPASDEELPAFIQGLRGRLMSALAELRGRARPRALMARLACRQVPPGCKLLPQRRCGWHGGWSSRARRVASARRRSR